MALSGFKFRGRSYIARYALGEGGGQPFYRKTTADGRGVSTKLSHISCKRYIRLEANKFLKDKNKGERKKKGEKSYI